MAFSFGFYDSVDHDRRYSAVQMSMIFDGLILDGVYATIGKSFVVEATEEPGVVVVPPGRAWFNHTWNYNDADIKMKAPISDLILNRIDAIVIDINSDEDVRTNDIIWVKGIASEAPEKPTLINDDTHHQYPLCYIERTPNTEIINQENITNAIGTSECPLVTGILNVISIDDLLIQWKDQWTQFIKKYEEDIALWTQEQQDDFKNMFLEFKIQMENFQNAYFKTFMDWFKDVQTVLDGDVAGNLHNEITVLSINEYNHYHGIEDYTTIVDSSTKTFTTTTDTETTTTTIAKNSDGSTTIRSRMVPTGGSFDYVKTVKIEDTSTGKKITKKTVWVGKPGSSFGGGATA